MALRFGDEGRRFGSGKRSCEPSTESSTRRLWILRHAKSSWSDEGRDDHDRPLSKRGERAARSVGAALARRSTQPNRILASTALRARATVERVQAELSEALPVTFEAALYMASPETWVERLRELEATDEVLVVGHNPGLEELVRELAPKGEKAALRRLRDGLPTAALAEIALPLEAWRDLEGGIGWLAWSVRPKDLARTRETPD